MFTGKIFGSFEDDSPLVVGFFRLPGQGRLL
jgi:hypothetical protein